MAQDRQIVHVDMDAFYASVEEFDNPGLVGKAVIVGGDPKQRGVVSAASYEARKFGVHSAMPMSQAVRLCPDAIVLPVRMKRYVELSKQIHAIFQKFTPQIEPISLDEAFLDVTGSLRLFGCVEEIGKEIKKQIKEQLGLVASVGIAANKFLAKLASDLDKPDGFVVITEQDKQRVLDPLGVSRIWGVGPVTQKALKSIGIDTIKQLREAPTEILQGIFGDQMAHVLRLAHGADDREVESGREAKSISSEQTFATDITDKDILLDVLLSQVEDVAQRLRLNDLEAKTITLKLRYDDFRTITRSNTFDHPTNVTKTLWRGAREVFLKWHKKSPGALRLLGFGASGLQKTDAGQRQLFPEPEDEKQKRLDKAFDRIRGKFGRDILRRGK
ncbi:MAG: DNA polymerase IV [Planctomycetes bacterium]|nr:DNA polymerase IV [Planctomycetota bacterium]MBL7187637.1 DNA polymerase IV [Phycisphaerae bacterium]